MHHCLDFVRSPNMDSRAHGWLQSATPRHQTYVYSTISEYPSSPRMLQMGNSPRHFSNASSNGSSNSPEHSFPPAITSPRQEYNRYQYIPLSYYTRTSTQPSPQPYRGYIGEESHRDWNRMHFRHQPTSPSITGQYTYWHEEAPGYPHVYGLLYHHVKPPQTPSLREYPLHQAQWTRNSPSRGFSAATCAHTPWTRLR